ncbi:PaaI family thioesterase, partial [Acinetobacter baumannii]
PLLKLVVALEPFNLNVKMIRPMQVDTSYYATAELINAGRNIISTQGKIVDENGKVYAFASATLMIIRK